MKAIAVDLGGTHATVGVVEDDRILASQELELDRMQGLAPALPLFSNAACRLLSEAGIALQDVSGLALSFCGLADSATGKIVSTNQKYDDGPSLDLSGWCERELGLPFKIENDARMALLGEWYAGAARGNNDVVMITLGTGVGGAAMMNGRLVRGKHVQGGCLGGHFPVVINGRRCTCGGVGCTEAEASGWALPLIAREWPGFGTSSLAQEPEINFKVLFLHANDGDPVAAAIRDHCLQVWAAGAVGLIHAYDPEILVIGGGVMRSAGIIIPTLQRHIDQYAWTPWGRVAIKQAELGNQAALLGAVPLLTAID